MNLSEQLLERNDCHRATSVEHPTEPVDSLLDRLWIFISQLDQISKCPPITLHLEYGRKPIPDGTDITALDHMPDDLP